MTCLVRMLLAVCLLVPAASQAQDPAPPPGMQPVPLAEALDVAAIDKVPDVLAECQAYKVGSPSVTTVSFLCGPHSVTLVVGLAAFTPLTDAQARQMGSDAMLRARPDATRATVTRPGRGGELTVDEVRVDDVVWGLSAGTVQSQLLVGFACVGPDQHEGRGAFCDASLAGLISPPEQVDSAFSERSFSLVIEPGEGVVQGMKLLELPPPTRVATGPRTLVREGVEVRATVHAERLSRAARKGVNAALDPIADCAALEPLALPQTWTALRWRVARAEGASGQAIEQETGGPGEVARCMNEHLQDVTWARPKKALDVLVKVEVRRTGP